MNDRSLSEIDTGTSIKSVRVRLVLWTQNSHVAVNQMISPCERYARDIHDQDKIGL